MLETVRQRGARALGAAIVIAVLGLSARTAQGQRKGNRGARLVVAAMTTEMPKVRDIRRDTSLQPYALTISGGVSLGAYEAGVNWALLEILRTASPDSTYGRPDIAGVTGASAGAINALLTAMTWCRDPKGPPDAERNLFARTWLPIGFDTLIPALESYLESDRMTDGLLSRAAFATSLKELRGSLLHDHFRPNCKLSMGLTVTRLVPGRIEVAGLSVANQRFVIPLEVSVDPGGRIHFRNHLVQAARKELLGNIIYLAPRGDGRRGPQVGEIDVDAVLDAVQASAAFPLAFGPVRIRYWVDRRQCARPMDAEHGQFALCEDWFMDGGVFDNIPLGVAMAQLETKELYASTPRPLRYLYIDSDSRRLNRNALESKTPANTGTRRFSADFGSWRRALVGAVSTARGYELHNVLRYNSWNQGTSWLGTDAAKFLRGLPGSAGSHDGDATRRARSALESCLGQPLSVFEAKLEDEMPPAMSRLGDCIRKVDDSRLALAALGDYIDETTLRLETARTRADSKPDDHHRLRGAVLRLVGALPEWTGAAGALPTQMIEKSNELASHAHLLAGDPGRERFLLPSRRFFPLAASHVAGFSAFLDEPLRRYDYYVGIHDGLYSIATSLCDQRDGGAMIEAEILRAQTCIGKQLAAMSKKLQLDRSKGAGLLGHLRVVEEAYWRGTSMPPIVARDKPQIVLRALIEGGPCRGSYCEPQLGDRDFTELMASLKRLGYKAESPVMELAMRDPERWWVGIGIRMLVRQRKLETAFNHGKTAGALFAAERSLATVEASQYQGLYTLHSSVPPHEGFRWNLLRLLPHEISSSLNERRTLEAAWQPLGWAIDTSPGQLRLAGELRGGLRDSAWFSEIGGSVSLHRRDIPSYILLSSLGAAAGRSTFGEHDGDYRVELFFTTLSDRLRFAVGTNHTRDLASNAYLTIGLSDFSGTSYSMVRRFLWLFD